jgi:tetratricopeptide (TPR) repeat protein
MKQQTILLILFAQGSLCGSGIVASIVTCANPGSSVYFVTFAIVAFLASIICGLLFFKSLTNLGKIGSSVFVLISLAALPDLVMRRLPAILSDPHAGEQQRLASAAQSAQDQGYPEAERLYKNLVSKERSGYFSSYRVDDELDLARILVKENKLEEAEGAYKHAIEKAPLEFRGNDPLLIEFIEELASVYAKDKKYNEAEDAYKNALAINERSRKKREQESSYYDRTAKRISAGYIKVLRVSGKPDQADAVEKANNNKVLTK